MIEPNWTGQPDPAYVNGFFDGCCEPVNPGGTAAFGAVIYDGLNKIWEQSQVFVPMKGREKETSNNVAEYLGFIAILCALKGMEFQDRRIAIYGDSKLVLCQMFKEVYGKKWKIRKGLYVPYARSAQKLVKEFTNIQGRWIPREKNTIADELSKRRLRTAGVEFKLQPE